MWGFNIYILPAGATCSSYDSLILYQVIQEFEIALATSLLASLFQLFELGTLHVYNNIWMVYFFSLHVLHSMVKCNYLYEESKNYIWIFYLLFHFRKFFFSAKKTRNGS